jgi:co-chaperonin GroES (HSP10)
MENTSGLKPCGRAVLVKPYQPERASSIIVMTENSLASDQMVEQRAIIVEVGPACWNDEAVPRAAPGDRVLIAKFAGHMAMGTKDGERYRFVNDRDIFAKIEVE